jgi:hypothetical protein
VLFRHGQVQSRMAPKSQREIACDHLEPEAQQSKRKAGPDSRSRHQCNSKGFPGGRGIGHLAFWREQEYTVPCNQLNMEVTSGNPGPRNLWQN